MAINIEQYSGGVNCPTKDQLLTAAVYVFMIHAGGLPDLSLYQAKQIAQVWDCKLSVIEGLNVCRCPSEVENLILCMEVAARYGELDAVPGFYRDGYLRDFWKLDINPKLCETGFIVPAIDRRFRFYNGLRVFRHARDMNPFLLTTRDRDAVIERRAA